MDLNSTTFSSVARPTLMTASMPSTLNVVAQNVMYPRKAAQSLTFNKRLALRLYDWSPVATSLGALRTAVGPRTRMWRGSVRQTDAPRGGRRCWRS